MHFAQICAEPWVQDPRGEQEGRPAGQLDSDKPRYFPELQHIPDFKPKNHISHPKNLLSGNRDGQRMDEPVGPGQVRLLPLLPWPPRQGPVSAVGRDW